jgi:tetratricopeptide (TPR) repeat protein
MLLIATVLFFSAYSFIFSAFYAIALAWIIERREKVYHLERVDGSASFLPGTLIFGMTFLLSSTLGAAHPDGMFKAHLAMLLVLFLYFLLHESHCRRRAEEYHSSQEQVLRNCRAALDKDPGSVYPRHRIVDILVARGEFAKAAIEMRALAELEKNVPNEWRLKELEEAAMKPKSSGPGLLAHLKKAVTGAREDDADTARCLAQIRQYPQNLALRHELAELYALRKEFAKAVQVMEELVKLDTSVQLQWRLQELKDAALRAADKPRGRTFMEAVEDFFFD